MAVETITLDSFAGGYAAQRSPSAFGEEQWARLQGFVIEDGGALRSQWPIQSVPGFDGDAGSLGVYKGQSGTVYLVVVDTAGTIWWAEAPAEDEPNGSITMAWNELVGANGETPSDNGGEESRRPVATVPLRQQNQAGYRSSLMLTSVDLADASGVVFVYEEDGSNTLRFIESTSHWPSYDETDGFDRGVPRGEVATEWNGALVVGDVMWVEDPNDDFAGSNQARHRNGLFISEPGDPFKWDTLNFLFVGDPHTRITGLEQTDEGLLVFTGNQPSGNGGVWILRGSPGNYSLDPLRLGVGADSGQTYWDYTGTVVWVTETGEIWQTDGEEVVRLDWQGLGTNREPSDPEDGAAGYGPYALVSRHGRVFCMRAVDGSGQGAWTELQLGSLAHADLTTGGQSGDALYFLSSGSVYRFTRADLSDGSSERGQVDGSKVDLSLATQTLQGDGPHRKTAWRSVGVRATAAHADDPDAELLDVTLYAGAARSGSTPTLVRDVGEDLHEGGEPLRHQWQVRGMGPSVEFAAEPRFRGDVDVESMTVGATLSRRGGTEEGL